jgi:hypothetical protein
MRKQPHHIHHYSDKHINMMMITAYCNWVLEITEESEAIWDAYILTFMFKQIRGDRRHQLQSMLKEVERVYAKSLTHIIRRPLARSQAHRLPVWICCADMPVPKHEKQSLAAVTINGGLHLHALALVPNESRLRVGFDAHLKRHQQHYAPFSSHLNRVHGRLITETPGYVTGYVMKSLRTGRSSYDDVLVLPRLKSELVQKPTALNPTLGKCLR